jgi:hypothetical protein
MALRSSTDRVALLDIETVYGTAATMTEVDAILLMDTQVTPTADKLERNTDSPFFGADPFVLVGKRVTLTAMCDLIGHATPATAAPLGKLYRILGHSQTLVPVGPPIEAVYAPISKDFESATIDFYWAGIRCRMTGARGSLDMEFSIKTFAKGTINVTGIFSIPTDAEPPAGIVWTAFQTPPAIETESWEVIVDGVNVCAQSLTMQANATVNLIECSEAREVAYTERKPTGVLRVYKDATLATWNPWSIADAQDIIVLENTVTKAAGLNVSVPMRAQLEYPKPIDIDGVAGFEIPFSLIPSGAGGDEYKMHFS